jgi:hypothetical protein
MSASIDAMSMYKQDASGAEDKTAGRTTEAKKRARVGRRRARRDATRAVAATLGLEPRRRGQGSIRVRSSRREGGGGTIVPVSTMTPSQSKRSANRAFVVLDAAHRAAARGAARRDARGVESGAARDAAEAEAAAAAAAAAGMTTRTTRDERRGASK